MQTLTNIPTSRPIYFIPGGSSTNSDGDGSQKLTRVDSSTEIPFKRIKTIKTKEVPFTLNDDQRQTTTEKLPSVKSTNQDASKQTKCTNKSKKRVAFSSKSIPFRRKPNAFATKGLRLRKTKISKNNNKPIYQSCLECSYEVRSFKSHFNLTKRIHWLTCTKCSFKTKCKKVFDQHILLSSCNITNIVRRPYGRIQKPSTSLKLHYCSCCKIFKSISAQELFEHLAICKGSQIFTTKLKNEITEEELNELKIFGSFDLFGRSYNKIGLANNCKTIERRKEENLEDKDEIKEYFSQFLPLSHLNNITPLMIKHLYENKTTNDEGNFDNNLKKIRLEIIFFLF
ncbi:hypothetical protein ACQ4LE_004298 [Meloidogyne hapla]